MLNIFGTLATMASLSIMLFGFPSQIIKNYKRKSTTGLSSLLIFLACCSYSLWVTYGFLKPDFFLIIAQTPSSILCYIILFQIFHYKKKRGL